MASIDCQPLTRHTLCKIRVFKPWPMCGDKNASRSAAVLTGQWSSKWRSRGQCLFSPTLLTCPILLMLRFGLLVEIIWTSSKLEDPWLLGPKLQAFHYPAPLARGFQFFQGDTEDLLFPNFLPRKGVYGEILNVEFDADEPLETVDKVIVQRIKRDDMG